jgi:hypothetical protein
MLNAAPGLRAVAIFEEMQRCHPGLPPGVRRTLERRIRSWWALHGAEQEVSPPSARRSRDACGLQQRHQVGHRHEARFDDRIRVNHDCGCHVDEPPARNGVDRLQGFRG